MSSVSPYVLLALAAGACLPTQAGINAQLNLWTRSPVLAGAISFAVGTFCLVALYPGGQNTTAVFFRNVCIPLVDLVRRAHGRFFCRIGAHSGAQARSRAHAGAYRGRSDGRPPCFWIISAAWDTLSTR